ncbi:hypothetical protein [Pedobacter deserti]|uniref:hypothetical protein n=1 Tax=Pedobacter deserti TaxID=2817382 RepID=UPI00210E3D87|nr:hypothetical protein [Pedobacter sp. SYSU D00382]
MNIQFQEKQRFPNILLWILFALPLIASYGLYKQLVLKESVGNNPAPDGVLIAATIFIYCLAGLFAITRLHTKIDHTGIEMRFAPFFKKTWKWEDIDHIQVINYGFVGGWGIRLTIKYGTVFNVSGSYGLAVVLKSGKKFVIGTKRPDEMNAAVQGG